MHPGADPEQIVMKYDGVEKLQTVKNELHIGTSVGTLRELDPYSYQYQGNEKVSVDVRFQVTGNETRFQVRNHDRKSLLVIDPTLIFCSFSGSTADNWGFTATYGPDGSFFGGGIVFGNGFPTSTGAFQTNYGGGGSGCFGNGGMDIGIIKLSPDGVNRVYATYIGGSGDEMPHSLICDPQGNLVIAGKTNSGNFPTTSPRIGGGSWDICIVKLNAAGSALIGSRVIGGSADDGANITPCGGSGAQSLQQNYGDWSRSEVILDNANNIYVAAATQSNNFPTQNPAQANNAGGTNNQDGVVIKFNPNLSALLFSTYLGGSGNDAAYVLSINPTNGDVFVAGGTESQNGFPGPKTGTVGPSHHGLIDGFVSILSPDGSTIRRTTYLGTNGNDQVFGIQFDRNGFPYVMGQTYAYSNDANMWPIINAPWNQPRGKQFIAKLRPDLSAFVYSTTFGKGSFSPDISPVAFLVDRCENVYVSGWGGQVSNGYPNSGVQGLPTTTDAIKLNPDLATVGPTGQGRDFYFIVLKRDVQSLLYGSYFGQNAPSSGTGDHVDGGTSRFDQNGVIYQAICAACGNNLTFPTTPPVWADTKPAAANCNLAMVKILFDYAGVGSGVQSSIMGVPRDTAGCVPLTVDFRDTLLQAVRYYWNFGDGSPDVITNTASISHTYNNVGLFQVRLIAEDSSTCNIRDTSFITIRVGATQTLPSFTTRRIDTCTALRYQFNNTTIAPPGFPFRSTSFIWDFGDNTPRVRASNTPVTHSYAAPGTYRVKLILVDTLYCNAPDSVEVIVNVATSVRADFDVSGPSTGCAPYNVTFENTSSGGLQFNWDFGDGTTSTDRSPTHTFSAGTWTVTLTAIDSGSCNIVSTKTFTITALAEPTASFTATPQPPIVNTPISFTNQSSPDAIRFKWKFGDGDSLETTSRAVIEHEYNKSGDFRACLTAYNRAGCPDDTCVVVRTLVEAALDVPNAFTPLSKDDNNRIFVRGFGIAKMRFIIWNRFGEKVFESNDRRIGWDGRYKGQLQPMDVYAYTLDVEFFDGTRATKKGDITLIR